MLYVEIHCFDEIRILAYNEIGRFGNLTKWFMLSRAFLPWDSDRCMSGEKNRLIQNLKNQKDT